MCNIMKICPDVSELRGVKTDIKCTEKDCNKIFKTSSNLKMHYMKHHLKTSLEKQKVSHDTTVQYHCPVKTCMYNTSSSRFFATKRSLKQHYLKVHAEKLYNCTKCSKSFSTVALHDSHEKVCGKVFKCVECSWPYNSQEALLTHCRRKNHKRPNADKIETATVPLVADNIIVLNVTPARLPNLQDKEVQTDSVNSSKIKKRNTTQQTQTSKVKKIGNNAETQTIKNTILEKAMLNANLYVSKSNAQTQSEIYTDIKNDKIDHIKTNTQENNIVLNYFEIDVNKQNTSLNILDNLLSETIINNNTHHLCNIETQTDRFDLALQENMDSSFTQTADLSLDQLLYSHMYTQTCDDILLSELGFNDSHTQTYWPGYEDSVSTETQTNFADLLLGDRSTQTSSILTENLLEASEYSQSYENPTNES